MQELDRKNMGVMLVQLEKFLLMIVGCGMVQGGVVWGQGLGEVWRVNLNHIKVIVIYTLIRWRRWLGIHDARPQPSGITTINIDEMRWEKTVRIDCLENEPTISHNIKYHSPIEHYLFSELRISG